MIRVSNLGLWEDPYSDVIVPSRNITMQGVDNYVLAKSGKHHEIMVPGLDYQFDGPVFEHPLLENGEKSNILSKILNKSHYADDGEKKFSKLKEKDMSKSLNKKSLENNTQGVTMEDYISNQRNDFVSRLKENNMNAIADESFGEMVDALYGFNNNEQQVAQNGTEATVYINNVPYTYDSNRPVEPWWSWNEHYVAKDQDGNKVKIRKDLITKINAQGNPYLPYYKSIIGGRLNFADRPLAMSGSRMKGDPFFDTGKKVGTISNQPYTIIENENGTKTYVPATGKSFTTPGSQIIEIDDEGDIHKLRVDEQFVAPWAEHKNQDRSYEFNENDEDFINDPFKPIKELTGIRISEIGEAFGNDVEYKNGIPTTTKWRTTGTPGSYRWFGQQVYPYAVLEDSDRFYNPAVVYSSPKPQNVPPAQKEVEDTTQKDNKKDKVDNVEDKQKNTKEETVTTQTPVSKKETRQGKKLRRFKYQQIGGELGIKTLPQTEYNIPGINAMNDNMRTAGIRRMQFNGPGFENFSLGRFDMKNYTNENNELDIDAINKSDKFKERGLRLGTDETGQLQLFDKNGNIVASNMTFKGRIPKGTAYAMTNIALNSVPVMADIVDRIRAPREMYYSERSQPNLYGNNYGDYALNSGIIDEFTIG